MNWILNKHVSSMCLCVYVLLNQDSSTPQHADRPWGVVEEQSILSLAMLSPPPNHSGYSTAYISLPFLVDEQ